MFCIVHRVCVLKCFPDNSLLMCCLCLDCVIISNLMFVGADGVRWITLKNFVLEDTETQCYDKMWYWSTSLCINCINFEHVIFIIFVSDAKSLIYSLKFWAILFWAENVFIPLIDKFLIWWLTWMWTLYPRKLL